MLIGTVDNFARMSGAGTIIERRTLKVKKEFPEDQFSLRKYLHASQKMYKMNANYNSI